MRTMLLPQLPHLCMRVVSTYIAPFHDIPSSHLSSGWIGTILCVFLMFILASMAPSQLDLIARVWSCVDTYNSEQHPSSMPSFTLLPSGEDKSATVPFGVTANLLTWISGYWHGSRGPSIFPYAHSLAPGTVLLQGLSKAEAMDPTCPLAGMTHPEAISQTLCHVCCKLFVRVTLPTHCLGRPV